VITGTAIFLNPDPLFNIKIQISKKSMKREKMKEIVLYPWTVMMEGSIGVKLFSFPVLVIGQQLTQIKTFGVRIPRHVERITLWFSNTKDSAIKLIFNHGRYYFLHP